MQNISSPPSYSAKVNGVRAGSATCAFSSSEVHLELNYVGLQRVKASEERHMESDFLMCMPIHGKHLMFQWH